MCGKYIPVVRPYMPPLEEYVEEIRSLWDSHILTHFGEKHQSLEAALCEYLHCKNVSLFTNGHLALEAALESLDLNGEVITTPFTFASTTQAIVRAGLTPVFCDIDADTYTIDPECIETLITEKTSAILPVHVYGNLCDHVRIAEIARKHNLYVIYDAAHAFGMETAGQGIANLGDVSMFSLHATKVFHSIEGGALAYNNDVFAEKFERWRMFGMQGKEDVVSIGTNAKLTEFAAAMGLCNLRHIEEQIEKRKALVMQYRARLMGKRSLVLCEERHNVKYNYAYMPVQVLPEKAGISRNEICDMLAKEQVYARKYFYPLTSDFQAYRGRFHIHETPVAKEISNRILCLPLFADLEISDVNRICDIIMKGCKE